MGNILSEESIKNYLLNNVQTVHWQMNNLEKRKFVYRTVCGVELAARFINLYNNTAYLCMSGYQS